MKIYLRTQLQSSVKTAEWNFVRLSRSNIRLNLPYSIHATRLLRQPGFVMVCKYFDICDQTRKIWAYFSVYVPCFHRYVSKCKLYVTGRAKYDTKIAIYGPCTGLDNLWIGFATYYQKYELLHSYMRPTLADMLPSKNYMWPNLGFMKPS